MKMEESRMLTWAREKREERKNSRRKKKAQRFFMGTPGQNL
jgi:hypothetical protein